MHSVSLGRGGGKEEGRREERGREGAKEGRVRWSDREGIHVMYWLSVMEKHKHTHTYTQKSLFCDWFL